MRYKNLRDGFEQVDVAVISRTFPRESIRLALSLHDKETRRKRDLPREILVYYIICLGLYMHANLQEVLHYMVEGLRYISGFNFPKITGKSGISQARTRLGYKVLETLHDKHVKPIAVKKTKGAWYKNLRLVAIDGSLLDLADEPQNRAYFGSQKRGAFPQARLVSLFECGTHIMFGARISPYKIGEKTLAKEILHNLHSGMLCLADRGFHSVELFKMAQKTGADLLFRSLNEAQLKAEKILPDGSYFSTLSNNEMRRKKGWKGVKVRVVEYEIKTENEPSKTCKLITTLLDYKLYPAEELAHLYHERWEAESILDELKTHLRGGAQIRLRSKTPELVRQEFYGMIMAHFAIRGIMHEAALAADQDPDTLSFTHSIHVIKRKIPAFASLSPS